MLSEGGAASNSRAIGDDARQGRVRRAVIASLACGVGAQVIYALGRRREWAGFWSLPRRESLGSGVEPWLLALLMASALVAVWPSRDPARSEAHVAKAEQPGRALWLLLLVPFWGLLASKALMLEMPGDGPYWMRLADSPFIMTSEPLGRWSHYLAYQLLTMLGEPSRREALRLASILAGCFQLSAILLLSPRIFGSIRSALPWMGYLFLSPLLILNLGYSETTPWAYALLTASLLAGILYVRGPMDRPPVQVGLLLGLAIWAHGCMVFSLGGYAILLLGWLRSTSAVQSRWFAHLTPRRLLQAGVLGIFPCSFLLATLLLAKLVGTGRADQSLFSNMLGGGDHSQWIAFAAARDDTEYAFLSVRYWRDLGNLLLTVCPMLPLAPLAFARMAKATRLGALYFASTLAGTLVLALFWNADFGMKRDADLLSVFAVPVYVATACWLAEEIRSPLRATALATPIVLTTLLGSVLPAVIWLPSSVASGHKLFFGDNGDGTRYLGDGWSAPEPWGVWSEKPEADLVFPIDTHQIPTHVRVHLDSLVTKRHRRQDFECWINGIFAKAFSFDGSTFLRWEDITIPSEAVPSIRSRKKLEIDFKVLNPASPKKLGLSSDARDLGVALHEIELSN